jgi:hypothetical protein
MMGRLTTLYALQDMAELAARLGSPVNFDRRGNVIWFDDFEDGYQKLGFGSGGAASTYMLTADYARLKAYGLKIVTDTAVGAYVEVQKRLSYPVTGKYGNEFSFAVIGGTPDVRVGLQFQLAASRLIGVVRYNHATSTLDYYDSAGSWQSFATGISIASYGSLFNTMKLVIDEENGVYVRCSFNKTVYDLSAYSLYAPATAGTPHLTAYWDVYCAATGAVTAALDGLIVTGNEV